jgi:hypothetical protein
MNVSLIFIRFSLFLFKIWVAPPEWMVPLEIAVEFDAKLVELGVVTEDGGPLHIHVFADTTAG